MQASRPSSIARKLALASVVLASAFASEDARADDGPNQARFYKGYDYGVQALYNPIWGIVSRGYDNLQLRQRRGIQISMTDVRNVARNVANPFPAIRYDGQSGWGTFLTEEIFPLSYGATSARWVPNYGLHLIGGGVTYAWMREWFLAHDAPELAATIFSIAALFTGALINESIENKGVVGYNSDALADLYVFDVGGVVLFSFAAVRKFFTSTVIVSDWSLQPAIVYPTGEMHNVGSYYAGKLPLPFFDRLALFAYGGVATLGGLSIKLDRELSLSVAAGGRISQFVNTGGPAVVENVVRFRPSGAVFLDRNESLLASVQVSDIDDYTVSANVYPNAFFHTEPGLGAWTAVGKDGKWVAGVSFTHAFGIGIGLGTR